MTIQEFISAAIEGGADVKNAFGVVKSTSDLMLDPEAWKAVGKVKGWKQSEDWKYKMYMKYHPDGEMTREMVLCVDHWRVAMHKMIDQLAEGKTLEEYIATL